jgi:hypothetical protein
MEMTDDQARTLARIKDELGGLDLCLPGSVVVRTGPCGKPACGCHVDTARHHGPFRSWTRSVSAKTVTRLLTEEQLEDYQALFDNHKKLKRLVKELETLSLEIVDHDPRWNC